MKSRAHHYLLLLLWLSCAEAPDSRVLPDLPNPVVAPAGDLLVELLCVARNVSIGPGFMLVNVADRRSPESGGWSAVISPSLFQRIRVHQAPMLEDGSRVAKIADSQLDLRLEVTSDEEAEWLTPDYDAPLLERARTHLDAFDEHEIRAQLTALGGGLIRRFQIGGGPERTALVHALFERGFYPYLAPVSREALKPRTIFVADSLCDRVKKAEWLVENLGGLDPPL